MGTMTLRDTDEQIAETHCVLHDDLDYLAGTWSAEDAAEFERATAVFETVDKDIWKQD